MSISVEDLNVQLAGKVDKPNHAGRACGVDAFLTHLEDGGKAAYTARFVGNPLICKVGGQALPGVRCRALRGD